MCMHFQSSVIFDIDSIIIKIGQKCYHESNFYVNSPTIRWIEIFQFWFIVSLKFQPNIMHYTQLGYDLHLHKLNLKFQIFRHIRNWLTKYLFIPIMYIDYFTKYLFSADRLTLKNIIQICELNLCSMLLHEITFHLHPFWQHFTNYLSISSMLYKFTRCPLHRHFLIKTTPVRAGLS